MLGGKEGFIRLGDKVEGGGSVISASGSGFTVDGRPVALQGDLAECATHQGVFAFVEGDPNFIIDGRPATFDRMKLACGCRVLSSCNYQWGRSPPAREQVARSTAPVTTFQSGVTASAGETFDEQIRFVAFDGSPVSKLPYRLTLADGSHVSGTTDSSGFTERVRTTGSVAVTEARFAAAPTATFCCAKQAHGGEGKPFPVAGVVTNAVGVGSSSAVVQVPRGKSRPLTSGEIGMARRIFKDAIDYGAVKVFNEEFLPFGLQDDWTTITPNGNLYCPKNHYVDDFAMLIPQDKWKTQLFMHEMVHVWQFQMGYPVKVAGIPLQSAELAAKPFGKTVYSYEIRRTHHIDSVSFSGRMARRWTEVPHLSSFNMEQQGDLLADYYCLMVQRPDLMSRSGQAVSEPSLFHDVLAGFMAEPHRAEWLPRL
ncbi:putative Zn-binding protein involved in type VI secretion [Lysobacter sp. OAE881]|uniref:PAAR domain-containing protein n=1 Tax=Lysobacter sp. OAE881 TaxID=2663813 RepID=UPI00178AC4A5